MELAVIVPTLNEADNIRDLIPRIAAALGTGYTIVIVDDNSQDGTQAAARELSQSYPVRLVARPGKMGLASAVIDGMHSIDADAYIVMDADLSHPPELLSQIRSQLEEHDLVVGSRHVKGGGTEGWPLKRKLISHAAIMMARPITPVKDVTSGFFAIRGGCLRGVELTPLGFKIGLECFVKADWESFCEVPFTFTDRKHGKSKLGGGEFTAYLKQLIQLYFYSLRRSAGSLSLFRRAGSQEDGS